MKGRAPYGNGHIEAAIKKIYLVAEQPQITAVIEEGKPAREGMIRLRDQTGAVELIELKALIQPGGFSLHHRRGAVTR